MVSDTTPCLPEEADPHSPFSVTSVVIGVLSAVVLTALAVIASRQGFVPSDIETVPHLWRMGLWTGFVAASVGVVLAVIGLCHAHHRKVTGFVGAAINAAAFFTVGVLVGLGHLTL
jgi:hypothetical protein